MCYRIQMTERRIDGDYIPMRNVAPKTFESLYEAVEWLNSFVEEGHWKNYRMERYRNNVCYSRVVAENWVFIFYEIVKD